MQNKLKPAITILILLSCLCWSCRKDDTWRPKLPKTGLSENILTIDNIEGIPDHVVFDRIVVKVIGSKWQNIATVEGVYEQGRAVLTLPSAFNADQLQDVDRTDGNMYGYWPATSSDPDARVATLDDLIAYSGDNKVGRVYLTDWEGAGESATSKGFIYYQYADRSFELTGRNESYYYYACEFSPGWNAFANVNPSNDGQKGDIRCTTYIPIEMELKWRFESWVYSSI